MTPAQLTQAPELRLHQFTEPMSDEEREAHIRFCGDLMQAAMARWAVSSCFSDRGEADHWRLAMEAAIKSRRPAYVARLEQERGLCGR